MIGRSSYLHNKFRFYTVFPGHYPDGEAGRINCLEIQIEHKFKSTVLGS